jgi:hypothetical protein
MGFVSHANTSLIVSRTDVGRAVSKALDLYVGRGRRYTVKELSNATGVADRMIECAKLDPEGRQGDDWRQLKPEELLSIGKFLGDGFTTEWLRLAGQGAFSLPDGQIPEEPELVAEFASDTAEVAHMAADGHFCSEDERALRNIGHRLVERGMSLVAAALGRQHS